MNDFNSQFHNITPINFHTAAKIQAEKSELIGKETNGLGIITHILILRIESANLAWFLYQKNDANFNIMGITHGGDEVSYCVYAFNISTLGTPNCFNVIDYFKKLEPTFLSRFGLINYE